MVRRRFSNKIWLLCSLFLFGCHSVHELHDTSELKTGDLLFHVTSAGNAITDVTTGKGELQIDHVAIYYTDASGSSRVVQAVYDGVITTPLDSLLIEPGYYLAGRVATADVERSIGNAFEYIGRPYDFIYGSDDKEIYCSELVLLSFVDHEGKPIFTPIDMTFRDAAGEIPEYWKTFYGQRLLPVPEGKPGSNPGELSRRKEVRIKYILHDFAKRSLQRDAVY